MLSRAVRPALRAVNAATVWCVHQLPWAAKPSSFGAVTNNVSPSSGNLANTANYATLREIEGRLKSIRNIEKITKTMKIVASTKLTRAQRSMTESRSYGQTSNTVFDKAETKVLETEGKKSLLVVCSSDKGLCGGIHSGMSRKARKIIAEKPNTDLVIVGEKCKLQLSRSNPQKIVLSFAGVGKDVPTFADAQAVADQITLLPTNYASIQIMYNKFLNATSYEPIEVEAYSAEAIANSRESSLRKPYMNSADSFQPISLYLKLKMMCSSTCASTLSPTYFTGPSLRVMPANSRHAEMLWM